MSTELDKKIEVELVIKNGLATLFSAKVPRPDLSLDQARDLLQLEMDLNRLIPNLRFHIFVHDPQYYVGQEN